MGRFYTDLASVEVNKGGLFKAPRYRLTAPLIYFSNHIGIIIVDTNEETDFDSTPRIPIFYRILGNRGKAPAALHDKLYTPPHESITGTGRIVTRVMADEVLRGATYEGLRISEPETLKDSVINILALGVAWMIWAGVRVGGWTHWKN